MGDRLSTVASVSPSPSPEPDGMARQLAELRDQVFRLTAARDGERREKEAVMAEVVELRALLDLTNTAAAVGGGVPFGIRRRRRSRPPALGASGVDAK